VHRIQIARADWYGPVVYAAKTAVAAGLAWFVAAQVLGNPIPVFAPLAALLTVQATVWESVSRGAQRVAGVIVGVVVAFGFARVAGIHAWSIGVIMAVAAPVAATAIAISVDARRICDELSRPGRM